MAIAVSFHSSKTPAPKPQASSGSHQQTTGGTPPPATKTNPAPSTSSSPGASSSGQSGSPAAPSSTSSHLNNAGPGDTIGLFVAVSCLGALAYRRYLVLKRA